MINKFFNFKKAKEVSDYHEQRQSFNYIHGYIKDQMTIEEHGETDITFLSPPIEVVERLRNEGFDVKQFNKTWWNEYREEKISLRTMVSW